MILGILCDLWFWDLEKGSAVDGDTTLQKIKVIAPYKYYYYNKAKMATMPTTFNPSDY